MEIIIIDEELGAFVPRVVGCSDAENVKHHARSEKSPPVPRPSEVPSEQARDYSEPAQNAPKLTAIRNASSSSPKSFCRFRSSSMSRKPSLRSIDPGQGFRIATGTQPPKQRGGRQRPTDSPGRRIRPRISTVSKYRRTLQCAVFGQSGPTTFEERPRSGITCNQLPGVRVVDNFMATRLGNDPVRRVYAG